MCVRATRLDLEDNPPYHMGRGYIPEEILLHPDNPRLAGYDPDSGEDNGAR